MTFIPACPQSQVAEQLTRMCSPIPIASGMNAALVVYHNKYSETRGWIKTLRCCPWIKPVVTLVQKTLSEALIPAR